MMRCADMTPGAIHPPTRPPHCYRGEKGRAFCLIAMLEGGIICSCCKVQGTAAHPRGRTPPPPPASTLYPNASHSGNSQLPDQKVELSLVL